MARKFQEVFARLKKNEKVVITCPEKGEKVIRAAIYDEKYKHMRARKATDLPAFGRIKILKEKLPEKQGHVRLTISIEYSGDNL